MRSDFWETPIVKTVATENKGIDALASAIDSYREFQLKGESSLERRTSVARWRILELLRERLLARTLGSADANKQLDSLAQEVAEKRRDPYSAVEELLNESGQ
jgi:LAO/AO transport system kinase